VPPKPFARALADLAGELGAFGARWYLFGAQAAIAYGSSRVTQDIDVTVEAGPERLAALLAALPSFAPRLPRRELEALAKRARVVPMEHVATSLPVDLVLAGPGLEELFLDRARTLRVAGVPLPVASPEDVVLMKLIAGRPHDLDDARAIVRALGAGPAAPFDHEHVRAILAQLEVALERSGLVAAFEACQRLEG
jgi:hypothetical protein